MGWQRCLNVSATKILKWTLKNIFLFKNGCFKAAKLVKNVIKVISRCLLNSSESDLGGVLVFLNITKCANRADMLLLVKCYDKIWFSHPSTEPSLCWLSLRWLTNNKKKTARNQIPVMLILKKYIYDLHFEARKVKVRENF